MDETVDAIARRLETGVFTQHVVVNVAKVVHMQDDAALRNAALSCDVINIDGMGVVWGARLLGLEIPERVPGIDLFERLLGFSQERQYPVFFLGARPEVVAAAVANAQGRYPGLPVAGYHHGYFWDDEEEVVAKVRESGAKLLFVAITSPKKEQFIARWNQELGVGFAMGVGGTFDILAGKTRRAPKWMQNAGLEWLYRVVQEPRRMWKRYLVTNSRFAAMLARELLSQRFR
jgi:N-acetylglucosaminyldiphosphoundecaprenol N-acetyl-beta-D-mannosaminyltransferase